MLKLNFEQLIPGYLAMTAPQVGAERRQSSTAQHCSASGCWRLAAGGLLLVSYAPNV